MSLRMAMGLLAFLLTAAACGGGVNKAGGDTATEPTLLTFANVTSGIQLQVGAVAEEVERLSDGVIEIEFKDDWRGGVAEGVTIEDVRDSEVDMAWVGARAFDDFGASTVLGLSTRTSARPRFDRPLAMRARTRHTGSFDVFPEQFSGETTWIATAQSMAFFSGGPATAGVFAVACTEFDLPRLKWRRPFACGELRASREIAFRRGA